MTGLRFNDGRSSMLGERISGCLREKKATPMGELGSVLTKPGIIGLIIFRFLRLPRRSWSLKVGFLGPVAFAAGETKFLVGGAAVAPACLAAVTTEPVSIWTTCLKEEASAWMKVVGKGLVSTDFGKDWGVRGVGEQAAAAAAAVTPLLLLLLPLLLLELE